MLELDTGEVTRLGLSGGSPRYLDTGHLVYAWQDGTLWAVGFDPERLAVQGSPVRMVEGLSVKQRGEANFDVSSAGRLVYSTTAAPDQTLMWVDRNGQTLNRISDMPVEGSPRLSPDGNRLAVTMADGDIWVLDEQRGGTTRLTFTV